MFTVFDTWNSIYKSGLRWRGGRFLFIMTGNKTAEPATAGRICFDGAIYFLRTETAHVFDMTLRDKTDINIIYKNL